MVIKNQEYRVLGIVNQGLKELQKGIGIHCALYGLEPEFAARRDSRDQVDAETTARAFNHRRAAHWGPRCPAVVV